MLCSSCSLTEPRVIADLQSVVPGPNPQMSNLRSPRRAVGMMRQDTGTGGSRSGRAHSHSLSASLEGEKCWKHPPWGSSEGTLESSEGRSRGQRGRVPFNFLLVITAGELQQLRRKTPPGCQRAPRPHQSCIQLPPFLPFQHQSPLLGPRKQWTAVWRKR